MIAAREFFDLVPGSSDAVNGGERSEAPADTSVSKSDRSKHLPARAGVAHSADLAVGHHADRQTIFDAARPVIVKEILALLGRDIPDRIAHGRYLSRLNFTLLCQRRDQLLAEQQEFEQEQAERAEPLLPLFASVNKS